VIHTTQLVDDMLKKGEIEFTGKYAQKVTYHDPCHLGRHMGVYEEPRALIRMVPEVALAEFKYNRSKALCCGAEGRKVCLSGDRG